MQYGSSATRATSTKTPSSRRRVNYHVDRRRNIIGTDRVKTVQSKGAVVSSVSVITASLGPSLSVPHACFARSLALLGMQLPSITADAAHNPVDFVTREVAR